jgi:hypothetical protein
MARPRARRLEPARLGRVRAAAQLLHRPSSLRDPADVVRRAAGIQAQDANAARLGIRARSGTVAASHVDRARAEDRSIVRTWAMRGTLHLLATEDLAWQRPLFARRELEWSRRRLSEALGVGRRTQDRAVRLIARVLEADGIVTRREIMDRLESGGIEFDRQTAGHHLPRLAVLEGIACLGPDRGRDTTYVLAHDWIGEPRTADRERALAEVARRYVAGFGPADAEDMASWAGLGLGDCRAALASIASELAEVRVGTRTLLAPRRGAPRAPRRRLVRLLPGFDNYLLGHRDREFAVDPRHVREVWPGGGIIRPTVVVDGRVVGTWTTRRASGRVRVSLRALEPLEDDITEAISREVDDVGRFEGLTATLVNT